MLRALLSGALLPFVVFTLPAQDEPSSYQALVAEHAAARAAFSKALREVTQTEAYKAAMAERDRETMMQLRADLPTVDTAAFVERFAKGAAQHAGKDEAVEFLTWIVLNGRGQREAAQAAAATILANHVDSEALLPLAEKIRTVRTTLGLDDAADFAAAIIEQSPHSEVKAWTLYWRQSNARRNRSATEQDMAQADADLAAAKKLAEPGSKLAIRIEGPEFEKQRLQIGMVAPDIVGEDLDGVDFKLSDYRGKVVVLDFWGDW